MLEHPGLLTFTKITVFALMLSNGINIPLRSLLSIGRRPALLVRSILGVTFITPLVFAGIIAAVDLPASVAAALALLAACPGAPLTATRSKLVQGNIAYAAGLQLAVVILAVITAPLLLALFNAAFDLGAGLEVNPILVAQQVAVVSFLPVALGLALQGGAPRVVAWVGKPLQRFSTAAFVVLIVLLIVPSVELTIQLGARLVGVVVLAAAGALLVGHLTARGADLHVRAAVATAALARNLGLVAFLAAANGLLREVVPTLLAYMVLGVVVAAAYALGVRRAVLRNAKRHAVRETHGFWNDSAGPPPAG